MKSIYQDVERENGDTMTVQIGDSGRVVLSFDGGNTNTSHYLTWQELLKLKQAIGLAVDERMEQLKGDLNVG